MAEIGKSKLIDLILSDEKQFGQMWRKNAIFPAVTRDQMESILCILTNKQLKSVVESCKLVKSSKEIAAAITSARSTKTKSVVGETKSPTVSSAAAMSDESEGEAEPEGAEDLEDTREADEAEGDEEGDDDYELEGDEEEEEDEDD